MDSFAITDQIDRILQSQTLARKSQLRKLLEVLFKNIDSQNSLTPDLVIQELWPGETQNEAGCRRGDRDESPAPCIEDLLPSGRLQRSDHNQSSQSTLVEK